LCGGGAKRIGEGFGGADVQLKPYVEGAVELAGFAGVEFYANAATDPLGVYGVSIGAGELKDAAAARLELGDGIAELLREGDPVGERAGEWAGH
jgi:hypothetical protein